MCLHALSPTTRYGLLPSSSFVSSLFLIPLHFQGVVLTAEPLEVESLSTLPACGGDGGGGEAIEPTATWLALDEVVDPQNLGALVRTAAFLGAAGIVVRRPSRSSDLPP